MFKFGMKADTIQFGILLMSGISMLAGFAAFADARYAKADKVRALAWEIHALYLTIPSEKLAELEKKRLEFEQEHPQ